MPRFNIPQLLALIVDEYVTMMPAVPPALNAMCQAAEPDSFPRTIACAGEIRSRSARS